MVCKACATKKDLRSVLCLPLAPFCLFVDAAIVAYYAWQIYATVKGETWPSAASYISLAFAILQVVIGTIGAIAIVARWAGGISFALTTFRFVIAAFVISLLTTWIYWAVKLNQKNEDGTQIKPSSAAWRDLGIMTGISVAFLLGAWWIFSAIQSLKMVVQSGGSGWEKQNYKELKTGMSTRKRGPSYSTSFSSGV